MRNIEKKIHYLRVIYKGRDYSPDRARAKRHGTARKNYF